MDSFCKCHVRISKCAMNIIRCPLHEAAGEMLKALRGLMPLLDGDGNYLEEYEQEILAAEAALAHAEEGSK